MGKVTIVANEFSKTTRLELQEEADKLASENNYSPYAIMEYFAKKKGLAVSLCSIAGQLSLNCKAVCR